MLLFDKDLSAQLQKRYVLSWESVRPVPKATIDFGEGRVLTRTLKGNCVFYLCAPDGTVQDILPGVYTPEDFLAELRSGGSVAQAPPPERMAMLGKAAVESPILSSFDLVTGQQKISPLGVRDISSEPHKKTSLTKMIGRDPTLRADSQASVRVLRPAAKAFLANLPPEKRKRPSLLTRSVYKEVLGIDLADPYLGLGNRTFPGID